MKEVLEMSELHGIHVEAQLKSRLVITDKKHLYHQTFQKALDIFSSPTYIVRYLD